VDHQHRSLRFRVPDGRGGEVAYRPAIVVHRGPTLFLVETLSEEGADAQAELLANCLERHSPELVLLAVAPRSVAERFPAEAYDEIYSEEDVPRVVRRIRNQDPGGFVEPFEKLGPR
jgi:hypothetical protein